MAEITFAPTAVARKNKALILKDATGSTLKLRMPNDDCAAIVHAALLHNIKGFEA